MQDNQEKQNKVADYFSLQQPLSPAETILQKIKDEQKEASDLFHNCKYQQAQNILFRCLKEASTFLQEQNNKQAYNLGKDKAIVLIKYMDLILNKVSLLMATNKYEDAYKSCQQCEENFKKFQQMIEKSSMKFSYDNKPQLYCLKISCLIKLKRQQQAHQFSEIVIKQFPYHKKLKQLTKLAKQKTITENQQSYMDHMFQKLCMHPKVRQYLKEEGFLTKVQRMIRNPSLTPALEKLDPRIKQASEALMMADEDWS